MLLSFIRKLTKKFFVITNVIVALLFIIGCYSSYFNPNQFWFFGFLTLGVFYLFLVLLVFFAFWVIVKFKFSFISLISFVLCIGPLRQIIKLKTTAFNTAKTKNSIRVMSWNIEHFKILQHKTNPNLKQEMFALIKEYNPDVACFQEMVGSDAFADAINYVPDIAIALQMPYYSYSYTDNYNFDSKHHFGNIIFSKKPILSSKNYNQDNLNYNSRFMSVNIGFGKDTFSIFNVHLQSLKFSKQSLRYIEDAKANQNVDLGESKSILQKLKHGFVQRKVQADSIASAIAKTTYPVIVCGDFNDVPNSYAYATIGKNLQNAFAQKGAGLGATFNGISPTLRIDNIFVSQAFGIEQYCRVKKELSDHYPVLADISLAKQ
jgi:endonuclease/exonuclease/phosphatase family metal-dependent hydrolase